MLNFAYLTAVQKIDQTDEFEAAANVKVSCGMQAKLNRDHKNMVRNMRRLLKKKEDELQAMQQQLQLAHPDPITASSEPDLGGQQAGFVSEDGNAHGEDAAPGPSNEGEEECVCCKEKDVCVAKLGKELADAKAQCQQRSDVQQRASAEFANLMEENKNLKLQLYSLRVSGS